MSSSLSVSNSAAPTSTTNANGASFSKADQVTTTVSMTAAGNGAGPTEELDESLVIDVIHDSDDNSSTTSGSDGGCTSTSHKNTSAIAASTISTNDMETTAAQ